MSLEDFAAEFTSLYICRTFDCGSWKELINVKDSFRNHDGLPSRKNAEAKLSNNPQFVLNLSKTSRVFIMLTQFKTKEGEMFVGEDYLFFMLQNNDGKRITTNSRDLLALSSGSPKNSMVISIEGELSKDEYTLLISNFLPEKEAAYQLQVMVDDKDATCVLN